MDVRISGRTEQEMAGVSVTSNFTMEDVVKMQNYYKDQFQLIVFNEVSIQFIIIIF